MAFSFFPRVIKFFALFQRQNAILFESSRLLLDLFENHVDVSGHCQTIVANELAANDVLGEIVKSLAETFITPLDREDIYAIAMAQENAMDAIRAITTRVGFYHVANLQPGARGLVRLMHNMHEEITGMVAALQTRVTVEASARIIKELKIEADSLLLVSLGEFYENIPEGSAELVEMIKWSQIYDHLEEAIAATARLAGIIEGVSLKNA